jgi:hypothetical protein
MLNGCGDLLAPSDRERFVEAMIELCVERGEGGLTTGAVVARSGLAPERFESLFGRRTGLERCMLAAGEMAIGEILQAFFTAESAGGLNRDSTLTGVRAVLELLAARPTLAHFAYITVWNSEIPQVREAAKATRRVLAASIDGLGMSSQRAGVPSTAADAALGGAETLLRREITARRTEELPRLLPTLVYGATVPVVGAEEALCLANRGRELLEGTAWA